LLGPVVGAVLLLSAAYVTAALPKPRANIEAVARVRILIFISHLERADPR
jgi:hypothetical protein